MHIHDLRIIREDNRGVLEVCKDCKKKVRTKKGSDSRIDNKKYLKTHVRDTAQPHGRTGKVFKKLYGEPVDPLEGVAELSKSIKDQSEHHTQLLLDDIDRSEVGSGKLTY